MSGVVTINSGDLLDAIYPQLKPRIISEPEVAQQPYSYIVFTDGTGYYAKNAKTGTIEYSDTDASKVIQYAINALPDYYSGLVHIKAGRYVCKSIINIPSGDVHLEIRGEGMHNTILSFETSETYSNLKGAITAVSSYFYQDEPFTVSGQQLSRLGMSAFLGIRDLTVQVKDPNLNGIVTSKIPRLIISNVRIKGYYTNTVPPTSPYTIGLFIYESINNDMYLIENLTISGFTHGVDHKADHTVYIVPEVGKVRNGFKFNGYGVIAIRPHVYGVHEAAYILAGTNSDITLINPRAEGPTSTYATVLSIPSGQTPMVSIHRLTYYGSFASLINVPYQNIRFSGVQWQASGTATIAAGSTRVTVNHGLIVAPSKVLITPLNQPPGRLWVENITSTSFDIATDTASTANLTVAWYAEV
jgi:hypothetical protein